MDFKHGDSWGHQVGTVNLNLIISLGVEDNPAETQQEYCDKARVHGFLTMYQGPAPPLRGIPGRIDLLRQVMNCPSVNHGEETGPSRSPQPQPAGAGATSLCCGKENTIGSARSLNSVPKRRSEWPKRAWELPPGRGIETRGLMGDLERPVYRADCR